MKTENRQSKSVRWVRLIWAAWFAAVVIGSLLPGNSAAMQDLDKLGINDKVEHFVAYALLAGILPSGWRLARKFLVLSLFGLVLLGGALEIAQIHVRGRTPDINDALADSAGVLAGALAGSVVLQFVERRRTEASRSVAG